MSELLQPHEGVRGQDLSNIPWLSFDDDMVSVRRLIISLAHQVYDATCVGNPAPRVQRMRDRITSIKPGDLVMEMSTRYRMIEDDVHVRKMLGVFIEKRLEWAETDAEHEEYLAEQRKHHEEMSQKYGWNDVFEPEERMADTAWYIQNGQDAGDICRWYNCDFMVIPTSIDFFEHPTPWTPQPSGGVSIDRPALIGALADSGFTLNLPEVKPK